MAEPASTTITAAAAVVTGAVITPVLGMFGLDGASLGAGLLGCVVAQVFMPSEKVEFGKIAAVTLGSVIVASLGAPFVAPQLYAITGKLGLAAAVTAEHANAVSAALLGGFAKPIVMWIKRKVSGRLEDPKTKEQGDA